MSKKSNSVFHKLVQLLLVVIILIGTHQNIAVAATVTLSPPQVLSTGGVVVTATGTFDTCTTCDSNGNCTSNDSGTVMINLDQPNVAYYPECVNYGHGSATCTYTYDRYHLHGTHIFYAQANDCNGSSTTNVSLTLDNTPTIGEIAPSGTTLDEPFDITAHVSFVPVLGTTKGTIQAYFVYPSGTTTYLSAKTCTTVECDYSYEEIYNKLFDYNHGGPYKIKILATGGGTSVTEYGQEFYIDKTPTISAITPSGTTLSAPFDVTAHVTFKPTLNATKGNVYAYLVNPAGTVTLLTYKAYATEECDFSYQSILGKLYDLNHGGPYKIRIRATGGGTTIEQDGAEFYIDKTPAIIPIEPSGKTESPFNIQSQVTFKPTLNVTKGSIYAYVVYASGTSSFIGSKNCATEECTYNYQEIAGNLYNLNPGNYQIKFRATGGGATSEVLEPFTILTYANNADGPCETKTTSKNPINYATGNKFFRQKDLGLDGPGLPLQFIRYYNSQREEASAAGYGWSTSFSRHLEFPSADTITLVHDWGSETIFKQNAQGIFVSITDEVKEIEAVSGGYELRLPDGGKNYFNSSGALTEIQDRNGNTQLLEYLSARLAAVEDNFGQRQEFIYDVNGKLEKLISPVGDYQFTYDLDGNLIEVVSPSLTSKKYVYEDINDTHNLTSIIDENNNVEAAVTYDKYDRALTSELADGLNKVTVTYFANQTRILTDSRNASKTVDLYVDANNIVRKKFESGPGCGSCPAASGVEYTFDDRLRITSSIDALGRVTTYTYDERGNKLTETEADGTAEERTTTYTYHPIFNLVTSITRESVSNPGQNAVTTFTYDASGNLTGRTETGYKGAAIINAATTYGYNPLGQLISVDGPRTDIADTLTFSYYDNDPAEGLNRGQIHTVTNALGHTVTFARYNSFGKPEQITDENGVVTTVVYNNSGRPTSKTTAGMITSLGYDPAGNLISVQQPGGRTITYTFTVADQLSAISDSLGNSITFSYDSEGNRIKEEVRDPGGLLARYVDFEYDDYNRLMKTIHPEGAFEERLYDAKGNLTQVADPETRITEYEYDALDRLTHLIEPGSTDTWTSYNSDSGVTGVRDPGDKLTSYAYDDLGHRISENSPDSGLATYTYDAAGNLISKIDARGTTVIYSYDALNRLTAESYPDTALNVSYTYDQGTNGIGRLTGMTDAAGTTLYHYNELGQLTGQERVNSGMPSATLSFAYDPLSSELESITYPSGLEVSYTRDANGKISSMAADGQVMIHNITYKPFGPVADYEFGSSSLSVNRTYDQLYRLSRMRSATVHDLTFNRDATGNVLAINDLINPPADQSFDYDSLYRLIDASGIYGSIGYGYDSTGNRQTMTTAVESDLYSYVAGSNRLDGIIGSNPAIYTYDAHGNMTGNGVFSFTYDQANRLAGVWDGEVLVAEYGYDGLNRRVKKTVEGMIIFYHYDPAGKLIAETDGSGAPLRDYIYLEDEPVAVKIYGAQAEIYYYLNNHLGTPQQMVDGAGTVVWQADYLPFGKAEVDPSSIVESNIRFPGQYFDVETGLHYNWHRYYDPATGRYMTPDPIGLAGGVNLYAYVQNNPVNFVDPLGLYWFRQSWQTDFVVGRESENSPVVPGDPVSQFIEDHVPAGRTFGEIHDSFVGAATNAGFPDWLVNIPSMGLMYQIALRTELLRALGIIEQPEPCE